MSRTKKSNLASARPRLRRVNGKWECSDGKIKVAEASFYGAYQAWLTKAIADAMKSKGIEYKGEVTVVKGVQSRPPLKLSQSFQINAERAQAVQAPIRSISGSRAA